MHLYEYLGIGIAVFVILLGAHRLMRGRKALPKKTEIAQEPGFAVVRGELQEKVTVQEVERRERVLDPLGAVPDLPFGHLNAAWQEFVEGIGPDDALWSFTSHWTTPWGRKELRSGYAIVRAEIVGPHFLTVWRAVGHG